MLPVRGIEPAPHGLSARHCNHSATGASPLTLAILSLFLLYFIEIVERCMKEIKILLIVCFSVHHARIIFVTFTTRKLFQRQQIRLIIDKFGISLHSVLRRCQSVTPQGAGGTVYHLFLNDKNRLMMSKMPACKFNPQTISSNRRLSDNYNSQCHGGNKR